MLDKLAEPHDSQNLAGQGYDFVRCSGFGWLDLMSHWIPCWCGRQGGQAVQNYLNRSRWCLSEGRGGVALRACCVGKKSRFSQVRDIDDMMN